MTQLAPEKGVAVGAPAGLQGVQVVVGLGPCVIGEVFRAETRGEAVRCRVMVEKVPIEKSVLVCQIVSLELTRSLDRAAAEWWWLDGVKTGHYRGRLQQVRKFIYSSLRI